MPTTVVEFVASTVTVSGPTVTIRPTVTITEFAVRRTADICRDQTLPNPQNRSLYGWYVVIIPTLILLCSFMNNCFSMGEPGSENTKSGVERLWSWMVSFSWRKGGKVQQRLDDKKVQKIVCNARSFYSLNQHRRARTMT